MSLSVEEKKKLYNYYIIIWRNVSSHLCEMVEKNQEY